MKNSKLIVFIKLVCVLFFSISTLAGGYVGNGGGLAEQNFNYAYTAIPRSIDGVLFTRPDSFNSLETELLLAIKDIVLKNSSRADRLVFISGKDYPAFFKTGPTEHHRIAVTGDSPEASIYVNTDLLYDFDGQQTTDLGTKFAILIHELGHQAGEMNHQRLDILGSKVRDYINQSSKLHELEFHDQSYKFTLINRQTDMQTADFLFQGPKGLQNLNPFIQKRLIEFQNSKGYLALAGFQLVNGNFRLELFPNQLVFQVWIMARYISETSSA